MIGVDWGTSNFRAYRMDEAGGVVARRESSSGLMRVRDGRFAEMLVEQVGDWLEDGERKVLLCGMVGSRMGWMEAPYVGCPAGIEEITAGVVRVPFDEFQVMLVPGVMGRDESGTPEVMRGEETEVMGIVADRARLVCHPGTHTKWITLDRRRVVSFVTCMTGEVFAALKSGTILAQMMKVDAPHDDAAFLRGVGRSAEHGGLLHQLFGVRTLGLMDELKDTEASSYLSGLLIGHEVRSSMPIGAHAHLVGAGSLTSLYGRAIEACGGTFTLEDKNAAARGLAAIGGRLKWE